jgi:transcriptional regulator with XRE-family HTH domain
MKHPVDVHVGKRVRHRRWMVGMTQQQLGDIVGIKFQQIQKYETGMNRISASRLWDIAQALDVSISFFFEGFEGEEIAADAALDTVREPQRGDLLADKEALELVRSYYAIPETQRRRLFDLARVLSDVA